jgi:hypothetical protein
MFRCLVVYSANIFPPEVLCGSFSSGQDEDCGTIHGLYAFGNFSDVQIISPHGSHGF